MASLLFACTSQLHVVTSMPDAEIGVVRSTSSPSLESPAAELRATGELHARVAYSIFDTWRVWVRAPGGEVQVQRYPTEVAAGPAVSCAAGALLVIPLIGCFWVSRPASTELFIQVDDPALRPAPAGPLLREPVGCANDTDCKGNRICTEGACVDPG